MVAAWGGGPPPPGPEGSNTSARSAAARSEVSDPQGTELGLDAIAFSPSPVGGLILAGGRGSRLSRDKGCLLVGGRPIVVRVADALREVCARVAVVGDAPLPEGLDIEVVADAFASGGPVQALGAGLQALATPFVAVAAWDMPFVSPPLLRGLLALAEGFDAVVPRREENPQPLCAVYSQSCAAAIAALDGGRNASMRSLLSRLHVRWLEGDELLPFGDPARLFLSVNTPEELALAQEMVG